MKKKIMSLVLAVAMVMSFGLAMPAGAATVEQVQDVTVDDTEDDNGSANNLETPYVYPITTSSPEWLKLESHAERVEACQIPENILKNMSTSALLETISNYPLLVDLLLFDRAEDAYQTVSTGFNGIEELKNRPNAFEAITTYIEQNQTVKDDFVRSVAFGVIALNINNATATNSLEDSLASRMRQQTNSAIFTDAYAVYPELQPSQSVSSILPRAQASRPKTPSGYSLTVNTVYNRTPELTQKQKNEIEDQVLAVYGLYPVREATAKYNPEFPKIF